MRLVSPLLKRAVYPLLSGAGYFRRRARKGQLCVVTYHGVRPAGYTSNDTMLDGSLVSADSLRAQLRLLKTSYHILAPSALHEWLRDARPLPPRSVLLTCDDGLKNTLTEMLPILLSEGAPCLFFVTGASATEAPGMLWYEQLYLMVKLASRPITIADGELRFTCAANDDRRTFWWDLTKHLSGRDPQGRVAFLQNLPAMLGLPEDWMAPFRNNPASANRFYLLRPQELHELSTAGMTIGAHTMTHPMLSQASRECAGSEIEGSRAVLEATLGQPVWAFAYPFGNAGSVTERDLALAEAAGYSCAFLNAGGGFGASLPPFALPRVHVTADMTLSEFEAHVSGFYRALHPDPHPITAVEPSA